MDAVLISSLVDLVLAPAFAWLAFRQTECARQGSLSSRVGARSFAWANVFLWLGVLGPINAPLALTGVVLSLVVAYAFV